METADDGVGIDKARIMDSRSLGTLRMRERCAVHHGKLRFVTKKVGAAVRAEVPVTLPHP
jgi:signal transduction histidine kinase